VEGEALGPAEVGPPVQGIVWTGGEEGMDGEGNTLIEGEGQGLMDRKPGKGMTFDM